jgi:hypothetical protein
MGNYTAYNRLCQFGLVDDSLEATIDRTRPPEYRLHPFQNRAEGARLEVQC